MARITWSKRGRSVHISCVLLVGATASASTAAGPLPPSLAARLEVAAAESLTLDLPATGVPALQPAVRLGGEDLTLILVQHSRRASDFRVRVDAHGILTDLAPPPVTTYRGSILGEPGSRVVASLDDRGLTATIWTAEGDAWQIQPIRSIDARADRREHAAFNLEDALFPEATCGVNADGDDHGFAAAAGGEGGAPEGGAPEGGAGSLLFLTQIAFDADFEFYEENDFSVALTIADIESILIGVDAIYAPQTNITYEITEIIVRTTEDDPYTTSDPGGLLDQFRDQWNIFHDDVPRDVAHLMTGRNLDGSIIGIATAASVCNVSNAYALSQSNFTSSYSGRVRLTTHEIGHNWSAFHCDPFPDCSIMCSAIGGCLASSTIFDAASLDSITDYRNSALCLVTIFPEPEQPLPCNEDRLTPSDGAPNTEFGRAVALDGDFALVGAWLDDDGPDNSGAAYVFQHDGSQWAQFAKLKASDGAQGDRFGGAVDLDGVVALIGAERENSAFDTDNGAAYFFRFNGAAWLQEDKVLASDADEDDRFGNAVGVSGDRAIVGARRNNDAGADSGSAYIFLANGSDWVQQQKLTASDAAGNDWFGETVAIEGEIAVVGAPNNDDNGLDSGAGYVFRLIDSTWTQVQKLLPLDGQAGDHFGARVALSGDRIVVGASGDDDLGLDAGAAYVFEFNGAAWTQMTKLHAPNGDAADLFASAVAIEGDTVIVASPQDEPLGATTSGTAHVFRYDGLDWLEDQVLRPSVGLPTDLFGWSVDVRAGTSLVGVLPDSSAALTFVYDIDDPAGDDCNSNGVCDDLDIFLGESLDCNHNGIPDDCDLAAGLSGDCDGDGVMDICEIQSPVSIISESLSPIDFALLHSFTIADPVAASTDVEITVTAQADLAQPFEIITIQLNGQAVGQVFTDSGSLCADPPDIDSILVPAVTFNEIVEGESSLEVTLVPSGAVLADVCDDTFAIVELAYLSAGTPDLDEDGIPDSCQCPSDLDASGAIGFGDLLLLLAAWGECAPGTGCPADLDGDGAVGFADLLELLATWGPC